MGKAIKDLSIKELDEKLRLHNNSVITKKGQLVGVSCKPYYIAK